VSLNVGFLIEVNKVFVHVFVRKNFIIVMFLNSVTINKVWLCEELAK